MGEAVGRSLVVGVQNKPPQYAAIQSASCPPTGACNAASALFSTSPNPEVAFGALVYGSALKADQVQDARTDFSNQAAVSSSSSNHPSAFQISTNVIEADLLWADGVMYVLNWKGMLAQAQMCILE